MWMRARGACANCMCSQDVCEDARNARADERSCRTLLPTGVRTSERLMSAAVRRARCVDLAGGTHARGHLLQPPPPPAGTTAHWSNCTCGKKIRTNFHTIHKNLRNAETWIRNMLFCSAIWAESWVYCLGYNKTFFKLFFCENPPSILFGIPKIFHKYKKF